LAGSNDILLVGCSLETFVLARDLGSAPSALVDPGTEDPGWDGVAFYRSDEVAVQAGFKAAILAIDAPADRRRAFDYYSSAGIEILTLTHGEPGQGTVWGGGLLVQRLANLSVDCTLGAGVRLNTGANVMHDVRLGDFVTIGPNAVLLAGVEVGAQGYVGANATVLQGLEIGAGATVGAGAVVTRNVPEGAVVMGNPARPA
jgi:sugar O-acyltransferase (sialic acid O-acetyltransferase NeuD family)